MTTNFFSLLSFVAVLGSGIRDPGSGMGKNQDPGSGINIPDPPHWSYRTARLHRLEESIPGLLKSLKILSRRFADPNPYTEMLRIRNSSTHKTICIGTVLCSQIMICMDHYDFADQDINYYLNQTTYQDSLLCSTGITHSYGKEM